MFVTAVVAVIIVTTVTAVVFATIVTIVVATVIAVVVLAFSLPKDKHSVIVFCLQEGFLCHLLFLGSTLASTITP